MEDNKIIGIVAVIAAVFVIAAVSFIATSGFGIFKEDTGSSKADTEYEEPAPAADESSEVTKSESSIAASEASKELSGASWSDAVFALDDDIYRLPFSYQDICSEWRFHEDYGYDESFETQPGDARYCSIDLESKKYDMDLVVGTVNASDSAQPIAENDIWAIGMSIEDCESYPVLELPGGITWGASLDDIEAMYGEPYEDAYRDDKAGYTSLEYDLNYEYHMTLVIYDEGGLETVTLENYASLNG